MNYTHRQGAKAQRCRKGMIDFFAFPSRFCVLAVDFGVLYV